MEIIRLVVDDVYTTGVSENFVQQNTMFAYKWCVFARKPKPHDEVRAYRMPKN